ncbi:MAG: DUF3501 family protein [Lysobacterales bacterium]
MTTLIPNRLTRDDLYTLEQYASRRNAFRAQVLAHKKNRTVHLGPHMTLIFEDRLTVQYQVQEMLRIERIAEAGGIEDELAAYNPLIPDGTNLKATLLIEFPDPQVRARELARLQRIEDHLYVEVSGSGRARAVADEDLDRSNASKTSAVHFIRFELNETQIATWRAGAAVSIGVDDERYGHATLLPLSVRSALAMDFA